MTQAVIGYWNKIGVKANLTTDTTIPGWISNALSKKFPVLGYGYGGLPMSLQAINWFEPIANPYNPFATSDPQILSLIDAASQAPPAQQEAAFQQVQDAGIKDAWYVGVAVVDAGYLDANNISAPPTVSGYQGNDDDVTPAS
jgi:peptide/nickel transport system substrate-binding protein